MPAGEGMKEAATAQLLLAANEPKNYQSGESGFLELTALFFFFFRSWKMALKRFAFKEASLLILDLFSGATLVHGKTAFKDIKPSPCTYQT